MNRGKMANKGLAKAPEDTCILVTGGAGFIGSHTCVELLNNGYRVVIIDDLSNSSEVAVKRVRRITGVTDDRLRFYQDTLLDRAAVERVFDENDIDAIIHFAGFKAVGESVHKPLEYYWNNLTGTLILCDVARNHGCKNLVFSSSATVYGEPERIPIDEDCEKHQATNPYGQTKTMLEQILTDLYVGDNEWDIVLLRYFNPIGAHESGLIGEDPKGIPNNLLPYVAQVAIGKLEKVHVFGDDYDTPDGTGVRDYIHVVDLARGHVSALNWMAGRVGTGKATTRGTIAGEPAADGTRRGVGIFNLGTGKGSSVLDVIRAFEKACGHEIPYVIEPRREGDVAACYAAVDKARDELGWTAQYDMERMCQDSWRWQTMNPDGYASATE
jgi:UDP-glucose 4-epimerase